MAERWEGDGKDPVWITGIFWTVTLFTFSASLTGLVAWWLGWATPADLQRAIGVPVGVGVCIALLLSPQRWLDFFWGFAAKCVLWFALLAVGLMVIGLVIWRLSDINFDAPLTLGGAIVIAMIILAGSSQRT
jgi:hypothetical protein